jgi:hypothetical protein
VRKHRCNPAYGVGADAPGQIWHARSRFSALRRCPPMAGYILQMQMNTEYSARSVLVICDPTSLITVCHLKSFLEGAALALERAGNH